MISGCLPIVECIFGIASDVGQQEPTSALGMARLFEFESGTPTRAEQYFCWL